MPLAAVAQSMTDDQVMAFVAKEHAAGTSNAQIVTKLMQRGVDISQIRRVRTKYESQMNQGSMSSMSGKSAAETSRMRTNNGKKRQDYGKKADAEAVRYDDVISVHSKEFYCRGLANAFMEDVPAIIACRDARVLERYNDDLNF